MRKVHAARAATPPTDYSQIAEEYTEGLEQSRRDWMKRQKMPCVEGEEFHKPELVEEAKRLFDAERKRKERRQGARTNGARTDT